MSKLLIQKSDDESFDKPIIYRQSTNDIDDSSTIDLSNWPQFLNGKIFRKFYFAKFLIVPLNKAHLGEMKVYMFQIRWNKVAESSQIVSIWQ